MVDMPDQPVIPIINVRVPLNESEAALWQLWRDGKIAETVFTDLTGLNPNVYDAAEAAHAQATP